MYTYLLPPLPHASEIGQIKKKYMRNVLMCLKKMKFRFGHRFFDKVIRKNNQSNIFYIDIEI